MPRYRRYRSRTPSDRRCGGEESELRVSLVGVSCVGTTTIGRILADRRGWPFFDLDDEIERHVGISIERLQARFLTSYDYRTDCAVVLERIATANPDCVITLPPSGLRDAFLRVVRRMPGVTVAVHDAPENILERITFYDIDSRRMEKHLTGEERILYLKEVKADISYFKRSYERGGPAGHHHWPGPRGQRRSHRRPAGPYLSAPRRRQPQGSVRYGRAYAAPDPSSDDEEGTPARAVAGGGAGGAHRGDHGPGAPGRSQSCRAGRRAGGVPDPGARPRRRDVVRCRGLERGPCRRLALGRVDDAVRTIGDATRRGCAEGAEMPCELAEKLMRSGHEPRARPLWQQARAGYTDGWSWPTTRPTTTGGAPIAASRSNRPGKPVSPDAPRHSVRPAAGPSLAWLRCAMGPGRSAGRPGAVLCRASAPASVFMPP